MPLRGRLGQQIRCNSGADGESPDEREMENGKATRPAPLSLCALGYVRERKDNAT